MSKAYVTWAAQKTVRNEEMTVVCTQSAVIRVTPVSCPIYPRFQNFLIRATWIA